jgi:DNA repair exonuclease SbcCD ATPase subunit
MDTRKELNYEKYIQYLYGIIKNLESQRETDINELQSLKNRLKNSEKLCDEKEKFILFREQQLLNICEETENKINKLKYRIQKLCEMSRSERSLQSNTTVKELLNQVWDNFKYLIDIYLDPDSGGLLEDEIKNLRDQTQLKFNQIENGYTYEITRLRNGIIEENENMLFTQQQTINEQHGNITELKDQVKRYQEDLNELAELKDKNENLQNDLVLYRTENQHLTESLAGAQEELLIIQQDFEEQSEAYVEQSEAFVELEEINTELREQIHVGNTRLERARQIYHYHLHRANNVERDLRNCNYDKAWISYYRDLIIERYEKWKNKTHTARQIILADQYNIRRLNRQITILKIQIQWFRFKVINLQINPPLPVIQQPQVITSWLMLH